MPQRAKYPEYRLYYYPVEPPEDVLEWEDWTEYQVCIPGPLIPYLLNVMRIYQWPGRVKTDDPAKATAFVQAWNDLIARVGASVECAPAMPYPILRAHPSITGAMQQSLDDGATWTTVLNPVTVPPMIRLRQHPTQPQLLQQSLDAGVTWTTAYDHSMYQNPFSSHTDTVIYNTEVNTFITENNNQWDESSHDVNIFAPQLVFDGSPEDVDRNKAICYASRVFVKTIMETAFQTAATSSPGDSLAGLVFSAVATGIGAFVGGPAGAAIGAFFSTSLIAVIDSGSDQWRRDEYGQYEDQLVCCMYTALQGEIPTEARFAAAFSGSECDLPPEAQEFVDALITPLLTEDQNFLAFLRLAAEGVQLGAFLPECPCEPPPPTGDIVPWESALSGFPGGVIVQDGPNVTITAEQGSDTIWRVAVEHTGHLCIQLSALSYPSVTYPGHAPCGGIITGGAPTTGVCYQGITAASTAPFTVTFTYALC